MLAGRVNSMYIVLSKSAETALAHLSKLTEVISQVTEELFKGVKENIESLFKSLLTKGSNAFVEEDIHRKLKNIKHRYESIRRCLQLRMIHTIIFRIICLRYVYISYLENLQEKLSRLLFRKQDRGVKHFSMMNCNILYHSNLIIGGIHDCSRKYVLDL